MVECADMSAKRKIIFVILAVGVAASALVALLPRPQWVDRQLDEVRFSGDAKDLSAETVVRFINRMDKACAEKDLEFFQTYLAKSSVITMKQGAKSVLIDKTRYLDYMSRTWGKVEDYTYSHKDLHVEMTTGKAVASYVAVESGKVMGRTFRSETKTRMEINRQQGDLHIGPIFVNTNISLN